MIILAGDQEIGNFNEAPIHESGKYSRNSLGAGHHPTSMRPRFMNRGSGPACRMPSLACSRHFNEAPIHESGKSIQGHGAQPANADFNEAPIHESGK